MALSKNLAQDPKAAGKTLDFLRGRGLTYPEIRDRFIRDKVVADAGAFEMLMQESEDAIDG